MAHIHYDPLIDSSVYSGSTLGVNLNQPDSKLSCYLVEYLKLSKTPCPITSNLKARCIKVLFAVLGCAGKAPLVPIALAYRFENQPLGYLAASLNAVAFLAASVWTSIKMTDQALLAYKTSEPHLVRTLDRARKVAAFAFNCFNAAIAQIPSLFLSYNYSQNHPYMVGLNALDIAAPLYSLNLLMGPRLLNMAFSRNQKQIINLKKEIIEKMDHILKALSRSENTDLIDTFRQINMFNDQSLKVSRFFETIIPGHLVEDDPESLCLSDCKTAMSKTIGLMLLSVQVFWSAFLTYKGCSDITTNTTLIGCISLYVVICHLALTRFILIRSTFQFINAIPCSLKRSNTSYYICDRLSPITSFCTKIVCLFVSGAAFIQAAKISEDFLPEAFVFPSTLTYGLGLAMFAYLPLRDLSHMMTVKAVERFGSTSQKLQLEAYQKLAKIKKLFEDSSIDSLAVFLLKHQFDAQFNALLHKHEIRSETLTSFLEESHINRFESQLLFDDLYGVGSLDGSLY